MHRKFVGVVSLYFHFISPRNCFTLPSIARRPHPATTEATALLVASRFARRFPSRVLCCGDDCSVSMHSAMCILHKYHHHQAIAIATPSRKEDALIPMASCHQFKFIVLHMHLAEHRAAAGVVGNRATLPGDECVRVEFAMLCDYR